MRLNLGSGDQRLPGFLSVDKYDVKADIQADIADFCEYEGEVEEIRMYQVLEHIPYHQTAKVLSNCYRMLQEGGRILIEVPELSYVCARIAEGDDDIKWLHNLWGEYHRPWDKERYPDWEFNQNSIHITGFTEKRLRLLLEKAGFHEIRTLQGKEMLYQYPENLAIEAVK